jgi:hypothetical protein
MPTYTKMQPSFSSDFNLGEELATLGWALVAGDHAKECQKCVCLPKENTLKMCVNKQKMITHTFKVLSSSWICNYKLVIRQGGGWLTGKIGRCNSPFSDSLNFVGYCIVEISYPASGLRRKRAFLRLPRHFGDVAAARKYHCPDGGSPRPARPRNRPRSGQISEQQKDS